MPRHRRHLRILRPLRQGVLTATGLLALVSLACSSSPNPSTRPPSDTDLQQQVADLQARLLAAEKRAIVGEVESSRLRRRVHDLEEQLAAVQRSGTPSSSTEPRPATSGGGVSISNAPPPSQTGPTPSAAENNVPSAIQDLEAPDAALPTAVGIEEEDLEEQVLVESGHEAGASTVQGKNEDPSAREPVAGQEPGVSESSAGPSSSGDTLQPPDDATFAAYDAAYVLFHEKRYREAEGQFVAFVSRYPNSELTDNAQFWIGESRYARQDYEGALEAFSATVANYPGGNKVPDAMLKAGKSLEALGRVDQARQTYLEIQRRFPETAVALAAQEQLSGLD